MEALVEPTITMALCNKLGNISRQSAAQNRKAAVSSMLNYVRSMSSTRLFIGGLSYGVDDQSLRDAFARFGDVVDARVVTDRGRGRSRGFGFVNFSSVDCGELDQRSIRVSYANDRPAGPRSSGGYGWGGGFGDPAF